MRKRILSAALLAALGAVLTAAPAHAAGLPQLDFTMYPPQLAWLVITFTVLYILMAKIALPRIGSVLEERQTRIEENLKKAEGLKAEAEAASEAYEASLADARSQALAATNESRAKASAESEARNAELNKTLQSKIAKAEEEIAVAKQQAMTSVSEIAIEVATEAFAKLAGEQPANDALSSAVNAALKARG